MCGRFVVLENENFYPFFDVSKSERTSMNWSYNLAPSQNAGVVLRNDKGKNEIISMEWGLTPEWAAKNKNIKIHPINARSEEAHDKSFFRNALKSRRCIVPASGFYEWQKQDKQKVPHYIHMKDDPYMALAGIYEDFKDAEGRPYRSFAIMTTSANKFMKPIHDRMPVILNEEMNAWLNPDTSSDEINSLYRSKVDKIEEYQVSTEVNSPSNDKPALVERVR